MSHTTTDCEWQQVVQWMKTNKSEWEQAKDSGFSFQNETKRETVSWRHLFSFSFNV